MRDLDFILIAQSETVDYAAYSKLPLDRLDVYRELVYPRMVHYGGKFRSHLDLINLCRDGVSFQEASPEHRRNLLSVWNLPSCAGMHLANDLLAHGIFTSIVNNFDAEWDRFCEAYSTCKKPPLVGISSTFHLSWMELRRITRKLLAFDPDMDIVVGGAFVNSQTFADDPSVFEKPMRQYGIRAILHGFHAERDLRALLRCRRDGSDVAEVANLAYLDGRGPAAGFHTTLCRWNPPMVEETPFRWDQLELPFVRTTVQLRASCGCPFSCEFCSYPKVAHGFQVMSLDRVRQSVESAIRIPGVRRLCFVDDTLNVPMARFKEICRLLIPHRCEWFSFLRVQFLDEEAAQLMAESGCRAVYLGIESADDTVLRNMNKRATRTEYEAGVELLRRHGIASVAAFVLGFPGETESSIRRNIEFVENSGVEFYTLKEFYYMKHAPVHEAREKYGLTGDGNQWAHSTMDSRTAYRLKTEMFHTIQNATFIDSDTSLWHLVTLCDAGFAIPRIRELQREINAVMTAQMQGHFSDAHPGIARLRAMLAREDSLGRERPLPEHQSPSGSDAV